MKQITMTTKLNNLRNNKFNLSTNLETMCRANKH